MCFSILGYDACFNSKLQQTKTTCNIKCLA